MLSKSNTSLVRPMFNPLSHDLPPLRKKQFVEGVLLCKNNELFDLEKSLSFYFFKKTFLQITRTTSSDSWDFLSVRTVWFGLIL